MFISKITLNPERTATRKLISEPRSIHGMIQKSFHEDAERILWSLDTSQRDPVIYVLSPDEPSTEHIVERYGRVNDRKGIITKNYDVLLDALEIGKVFRMKAVLNPTITVAKKRVPIVGYENLCHWLENRSEINGFKIVSSIDISNEKVMDIRKKDTRITLNTATFEANIEITDENLFRNVLINGLGRGKAYGLGFVTVSRT